MAVMHRQEALALLKEILACHAANPNWISIREKEPNKYEISIKGQYDKNTIDLVIQARGLTSTESCGALTIC